jgi:iron complex transport system ATP-binding protein
MTGGRAGGAGDAAADAGRGARGRCCAGARARAGGPPPTARSRRAGAEHHPAASGRGEATPVEPAPAWLCRSLTYRYPGAARAAIDDVTAAIPAGRLTAVIGPNGSGKSTLLRLLLGTVAPERGEVHYAGRALGAWTRAALAREVGAVAQGRGRRLPRSPCGRWPRSAGTRTSGPWRRPGPADAAAVEAALARCDVLALADRPLGTLSGGERQRARVARALAQEPRALALDEPTAALDVRHEMEIFELLAGLRAGGATVVAVTHNLNLAARYADHLVLLDAGRVATSGTPAAVLTRETVERVYGWPVRVVPHAGPGRDAGAPQVVPLAAGAEDGA